MRFILSHWFILAAPAILLLVGGPKPDQWQNYLQQDQVVGLLLGLLFLLYVLGIISMFVSRRKLALHDSITGTIVMYDLS